MNMDIPVVENIFIEIQQRSMCLNVLQRQHSRLFHYITQVSGQRQAAAFAATETGFDEQNLTADSSPRQAGNHTGIFIALILVARIFGSAQEFVQIARLNFGLCEITVRSILTSRFAQNLSNLLLQLTHTAFTGIRLYNRFQRILGNLDIVFLHTVCFQLFGNQMATGNLYLFLGDITAYFNQLHAVEQRSGNRIQIIGGSNEHYFRQIIIHIQEVVVERSILLRVEYFEQSGRGVSLTVGAHLVYLIQYKYRI